MQRLEIDRPVGEADRERQCADKRQDRRQLSDARKRVNNSSRADAPSGRRKARSFGAVHHAAHGGPGASARSDVEPSDQVRIVLRELSAATDGFVADSEAAMIPPSRCRMVLWVFAA